MSTNYEFHWARTHYYRSVVNADSLEEAPTSNAFCSRQASGMILRMMTI
jgi:hypothetical protein